MAAGKGAEWEDLPVFLSYVEKDSRDKKLIKKLAGQFAELSYEEGVYISDEFYPILGRLIDQGNLKLIWQWAYLDFYKDKELSEEVRVRIKKLIEWQEDRRCFHMSVILILM